MGIRIDRTGFEMQAGAFYLGISLSVLGLEWGRSGICLEKEPPARNPAEHRPLVETGRKDATGCRSVSVMGWSLTLQRDAWRSPVAA